VKNNKHIPGFKAPEGYFENFEEQLFLKIEEDAFPKETGFSVPEGYFENLEETVLQNIIASEKQKDVIPLFQNRTLIYITAIAACVAIIFSVINTKETIPNQMKNLPFSSIDSYINEGNLGFDSYDVIALLNDEDVSNLNFETNIFSEENLENYLLENIDNTQLLIE
jgi:hypothetical protein